MNMMIQVQFLDEVVCISHILNSANILGKGMHLSVFSLARDKYSRLGSLALVWQPVKEKENSGFKPVTRVWPETTFEKYLLHAPIHKMQTSQEVVVKVAQYHQHFVTGVF